MGVAAGVVLRSLPGTYSVSGGVDHPKAAWTVSKTFANGDAEGAFTIDGELTLAGQFAQAEQVVGFKVLVDGVELPQRQLLGGLSVRTDLEVGTAFGLSVAYGSDDSLFQHLPGSGALPKPFGTIVGNVGAGKQVIDIYGVVVTDIAGRTDIPLVVGGVIDQITTEIVDGVRAQTISGIGQQGQYDGIKVTLQLSPGHNIPRGNIFARLAELGGLDPAKVETWGGTRVLHELSYIDTPWLEAAREIAAADNRAVWWLGDVLTTVPLVDKDSPVAAYIEPHHWIDSSVEQSGGSQVPTSVLVTGSEQLTKQGDGLSTVVTVVEVQEPFAIPGAEFSQGTNGVLTALSGSSSEALRVTSRVETTQTSEGDTLLYKRVRTFGYFNPEEWRYKADSTTSGRDGSGNFSDYNTSTYIFDSAAKNDGSAARLWRWHRFVLLEEVETFFHFDDRGFLVREEVLRRGWLNRRKPIKNRAAQATSAWSAVSWTLSQRLLGNSDAVIGASEGFTTIRGGTGGSDAQYPYPRANTAPFGQNNGLLGKMEVVYTVTDDGFITRRVQSEYGWIALWNGRTQLFGDGTESDDIEEKFRVIRTEETTYQAVSEFGSTAIRRTTDENGSTVSVETEEIDSYLPAAEIKEPILAPDAEFWNVADIANRVPASRGDSKPLECEIESPALLATKFPRPTVESFQMAESEEDCAAYTKRLLSQSSGIPVAVTLPASYTIVPGTRVFLNAPDHDIAHELHIKAIENSAAGPTEPIFTRVEGEIHLV